MFVCEMESERSPILQQNSLFSLHSQHLLSIVIKYLDSICHYAIYVGITNGGINEYKKHINSKN